VGINSLVDIALGVGITVEQRNLVAFVDSQVGIVVEQRSLVASSNLVGIIVEQRILLGASGKLEGGIAEVAHSLMVAFNSLVVVGIEGVVVIDRILAFVADTWVIACPSFMVVATFPSSMAIIVVAVHLERTWIQF
jgi:hypothetical protein